MRKGLLISTAALALLLAAPAAAPAAQLGFWRVAVTASIKYEWNHSTTFPCGEVGPGSVTASVTGRSGRFRMGYFAGGGYRHWAIYPRIFRATGGTVSAVDGTHQNPSDESYLSCTPTDKSGCVTRPVDRRRTLINVSGKNARRNVGALVDVGGLLSAFESLPRSCDTGGMRDFGNFVGVPRADYGQVLVRMPPAGRIGRRAFRVTRTETSSGRSSGTSGRATRRVTLRFTPA